MSSAKCQPLCSGIDVLNSLNIFLCKLGLPGAENPNPVTMVTRYVTSPIVGIHTLCKLVTSKSADDKGTDTTTWTDAGPLLSNIGPWNHHT